MTFSGLGATLLGFGSTRSRTSEPVRTGTPLAANLLCQPHASRLDAFPKAVAFSFLALLGGSCPCTASLAFILPMSQSLQLARGPSAGSSCEEWSEQQV